uniref:Putative secreted protein n=1 Tax=Anopheles darlingi TaxID=43151 RepID=A0A2M4DC23_ANODA
MWISSRSSFSAVYASSVSLLSGVSVAGCSATRTGCSSSFGGPISFSFREVNIRLVFLSVMVWWTRLFFR